MKSTPPSTSQPLEGEQMHRIVTVWGQVGKTLVLAPLPLSVADIEVDMNWA